MLASLLSLEFRRKRQLGHAPAGPLHDFYAVPFPSPRSPCSELEFVALDLETTGLDPQRDEILSFGWVPIRRRAVELAGAEHRLIHTERPLPERSVVIHQLTDDQVAAGEPLERVLTDLLALLAGRVLIAHHARFEVQFLRRACERVFGGGFVLPVVDTQEVARRTLERRNQAFRAQQLRLAELRERHHLPRYRLHNALSDALAAAELFLAQLDQYSAEGDVALKKFLLKV
ncbi:MAG: exonuclease domain-containing protein [Pseudomonadota bacterium]